MSGAIGTALAQARKEFAGNPRLQIGGWLIVAITVFYVWLVLNDWRTELEKEYVAQAQRLDKIRSLAGQNEWLDRAAQARTLRDGLQAQIPAVATLGLAQASAQTLARDIVSAGGGSLRVQSEAATEVGDGSGLWRVPVVISGSLGAAQVLQLMRRIESEPNLVVIEQAMILNRDNRTFSLTMVSYFRVQEGGSEPG